MYVTLILAQFVTSASVTVRNAPPIQLGATASRRGGGGAPRSHHELTVISVYNADFASMNFNNSEKDSRTPQTFHKANYSFFLKPLRMDSILK